MITKKTNKYKFTFSILIITLMILAIVFAFSFDLLLVNNVKTSAFVASKTPESLGSLTFADYATRSGAVFDGVVLEKLYGAITSGQGGASTTTDTYENAFNKVKGSVSNITGFSQNYPVLTENYSMDFRALSGGVSSDIAGGGTAPNPITVEFGGLKWNVVYATTRTVNDDGTINEGSGDLIVTLWLSETDGTKHQWGAFTSTDTSGNYICDLYSNSMVRISSLNGGGGDTTGRYATGTNTLSAQISAAQQKANIFAPFTLSETFDNGSYGSYSLKEYLEPIKHLQYQRAENFVWAHSAAGSIGWLINEAWGDGTDGVTGPSTSIKSVSGTNAGWGVNTTAPHTKATYYDWKEDTLWLPSIVEIGRVASSTAFDVSLWGIPKSHDIVKSDMGILTRSGAMGTINNICYLDSEGNSHSQVSPTYAGCGIRPAIHLNLTKAEENSTKELAVPTQLTSTYNAQEQTIADADGIDNISWFNAAIYGDDSKIKIEYLDSAGVPLTDRKPKDADTYTVKYTIVDTDIYNWSDSSGPTDNVRTSTFVIRKKTIDLPKLFNDEYSKVYNGGKNINFTVANYDKNALKIEFKGSEIPTNNTVSVTEVGDYQLDVSLIDSKNYALNSAATKIDFYVTKFEIEIKLSDRISGSSDLSILLGADKDFDLEVAVGKGVHENETNPITVPITIIANEVTGALQPAEVSQVTLTSSDTMKILNISAADLLETSYNLSASTTNPNYDVKISPAATLAVSDASSGTAVRWQLYADNVPVSGQYKNAEIGETSVTLSKSITYDGRQYTFRVTCPDGYEQDMGFGVSGFEIIPTNTSNTAVGKNADTYTTKINLINTETKAEQEYTITWTIAKAKFNLTDVTWVGDGKLQYTGDTVYAELENLPTGLTATYSNNKGLSVGEDGTASVRFTLTGDYAINYETPTQGGKDTNYIFEGSGDFEWTKDWEVVKAEIKVGQDTDWTTKLYTDDEGNTYDIPVLIDESADGVVEYVYYETDSHGNILEGTEPIELEDIEYSVTERKYYKALPKIIDTSNYAFSDGVSEDKYYSPFFTVGGGASQVSVSIASDKIEYNGKPRNVKLVISGSGATLNDFTLTYYSGDIADEANKLDGAPTERGNYLVVITSNKTSVVLSGTTQYTFEIIAATIDKSWNKDAKPYVLNLKYGQIDGIEYEIADAQGNPVEYSQLTAGNTYQIKAVIKEGMRNNYSFTDGTYETDWETFELRAEDIADMQDPNDSNNTYYPQEDEDSDINDPDDSNPGSGDVTGSGNESGGFGSFDEILAKLKAIPLWQIIASVISIILIIIFLSKTAGYESKRKKYKKKADKLETSVYAGAFLGLAFTAWTAIACVLMGLAVASLVIMLIAKSRCNKAEEEYEEVFEEYQQKKEEKKEESLRMMFMGMGNNGGMSQGMPQGFAYAQPAIGAEDIRGIISETVTALLPGMQQMLPQQASGGNDELVQKLLEKTTKNEEAMQKLIKKVSEQQPVAVEREVAASVSDEVFDKLANTLQSSLGKLQPVERDDEALKQILKNQENLMQNQERLIEKILGMSLSQPQQPQVVEKVVEKEVPVEKIVEKVVEVPVEVEKIVEKEVKVEVPVEVEKIVEVPVEKVVEKVVEKEVKVHAPAKPKAEKAPRLTLDEAYALLSKEQKKYFDGLRDYAMTKYKCKEKKSTYFVVYGQTSTNPLLKLTIKKDTTVALLKMEDEYMKDIRRDATGDGTKVRVKETEVIVSDAQAYATAKKMVDLRDDQIERYADLLREQRAMKKK